ncbi:MAG TPA: alpha/beta family hydrolase [Terriglobia bacterium]|nr:alpha/beta family hydrolase [Terriglobia bacterium]
MAEPPPPSTRLERLTLTGPAGQLEALLERDPSRSPRRAALVCHPHPQFGGTMHNKVVFRAAKAMVEAGAAVLRFNFRGVGTSEGEYDGGVGERDDVRAALDALTSRFPAARLCLAGFSFGASVGLAAGAGDRRVEVLVGLGLPVASTDFGFLRQAAKPKLIVQGTEDEYGPRAAVEALFRSLPDPKRIHWVDGADHFFTGRLDEVQAAIRGFVEETLIEG